MTLVILSTVHCASVFYTFYFREGKYVCTVWRQSDEISNFRGIGLTFHVASYSSCNFHRCKRAKTEEIKHDFTPIVNRKKTDLPLWNFILNELITQHNVAKCIWINFHYNFIVIIIHEGILNTPKSVKLDDTFVFAL